MKPIASRVKELEPFIVMTLLEKALAMERQGISVIHFEIGEPDFDAPLPVLEAAKKACNNHKTHYTHSLGNLSLREAIAAYKKKSRNLTVNPQTEIMATAGTSPGFMMSLSTLINPGDNVILTNPCYPCYPIHVRFFGGIPKFVPIYENENFNINIELLAKTITPKTKAIIINSPSNPTGQIIPEKTLKEIADLAIKNDLWVISDEIYTELTYNDQIAPSISTIPEMHDRTIILDGLSKYWAMTGFRLGYIIAPSPILLEMNKVNTNFFISAPSISQEAGVAALALYTETKQMLSIYKQRRDYITNRLNKIPGFHLNQPSGAFYAFVNVSKSHTNSKQFAFDLLDHAHIAVTPGIGFGSNGEGFMRFSYCTDQKNIEEGMNRLEDYMRKI